MGLGIVPFGMAQALDLGFSTALPSTGLEHRPEGGDKYGLCASEWKHLLFLTATVRDAVGFKEELGACVDLSFLNGQPLASCSLSSASPA